MKKKSNFIHQTPYTWRWSFIIQLSISIIYLIISTNINSEIRIMVLILLLLSFTLLTLKRFVFYKSYFVIQYFLLPLKYQIDYTEISKVLIRGDKGARNSLEIHIKYKKTRIFNMMNFIIETSPTIRKRIFKILKDNEIKIIPKSTSKDIEKELKEA